MNDIEEKLTKQDLLDQIRSEHGLLEATLARLTHAQMLLPGVDGVWSVKDVLAHISTWEHWMIQWTNSLVRGEKPVVPEPWDVDRMNADNYKRVKDFSLADVLEEFHLSYRDAVTLAEGLSEEQLQSNHLDTWPMGLLWRGIADNTSGHYKEHRSDILAWIKKQGN